MFSIVGRPHGYAGRVEVTWDKTWSIRVLGIDSPAMDKALTRDVIREAAALRGVSIGFAGMESATRDHLKTEAVALAFFLGEYFATHEPASISALYPEDDDANDGPVAY